MLNDRLLRRAETAVAFYGAEAQWWRIVPEPCQRSRDRLLHFIELAAPSIVVHHEIKLLRQRVRMIRRMRLTRLD